MPLPLRIAVTCRDSTGLVSVISNRLLALGANFADATFNVLGEAAEFSAVLTVPDTVSVDQVRDTLRLIPHLSDADITVAPFSMGVHRGASAEVTHRVTVGGSDRPGLIARLTWVFEDHGANIVHMNAVSTDDGDTAHYAIQFAVSIPSATAEACLTAVRRVAADLELTCQVDG